MSLLYPVTGSPWKRGYREMNPAQELRDWELLQEKRFE